MFFGLLGVSRRAIEGTVIAGALLAPPSIEVNTRESKAAAALPRKGGRNARPVWSVVCLGRALPKE